MTLLRTGRTFCCYFLVGYNPSFPRFKHALNFQLIFRAGILAKFLNTCVVEIIISGTFDAVAPATDISFINIYFFPMLKYRKVKSFIYFLFLFSLGLVGSLNIYLVIQYSQVYIVVGLQRAVFTKRFQIKYRETVKRCSGLKSLNKTN